MSAPYEVDFANRIHLAECIDVLQELNVSDRAKVVKTWLHGWATSHRIKGEFLHNCLLGCMDSTDSLAHYLQCPRLFAAVSFLWQEASADPLVRCGLCQPSKRSLVQVACTFSAYHALKGRFLVEFASSGNSLIPSDKHWVLFAQSLAAAAVESCLTSTLFDPAQFKQFFNLSIR